MPLFQNESKCETFHMKMSSACSFIFMQFKVIFIRMVSHLDSLCNRGTRELRNGLLLRMAAPKEKIVLGFWLVIQYFSPVKKSHDQWDCFWSKRGYFYLVSKTLYLYKKRRVFVLFFTVYNSFACMSKAQQARNTTSFMYIKNTFIKPW